MTRYALPLPWTSPARTGPMRETRPSSICTLIPPRANCTRSMATPPPVRRPSTASCGSTRTPGRSTGSGTGTLRRPSRDFSRRTTCSTATATDRSSPCWPKTRRFSSWTIPQTACACCRWKTTASTASRRMCRVCRGATRITGSIWSGFRSTRRQARSISASCEAGPIPTPRS